MIPVLALGLYILGLLLAFGVRSLVLRRRTGDTGLRLAAGPAGSPAWWAKLSFIAAIGLGFAGPVAALAGMDPVSWLDHPAVRVAGTVLAVAGLVATLVAQADMGRSWRVGVDPTERTTLVTSGAFGLVRNPVFTAMCATLLGMTLMVGNLLAVLATVVLIGSVELQVRAIEEPYLLRTHGRSYAGYAARVGRFLPGLGTIKGGPAGGAAS
ncbi:MAG TPA: isoprenylcysteine carboxylmethyltransferase family protein [Natronosporangium sp.]